MHLLALGLNHTTAPLAIRERVAFGPEETAETIGRVLSRLSGEESGHITEALILSTCNRTELYCAAEDPDLAIGALEAFLAEEKNLSISELTPHTYALTDLADWHYSLFRTLLSVTTFCSKPPKDLLTGEFLMKTS